MHEGEENDMIEVTKFDHRKVLINIDQIERVEACPDTIITFINGKQMMVRETKEEIWNKFIEIKRMMYSISMNCDVGFTDEKERW